jgi:drug/metabolite transporter (DMT)-like permease
MTRKPQVDTLGIILLTTISALMGVNQVIVKLVNSGLGPIFQAGLRSLFALLLILGFALLRKKNLSITDGSFWPGILAGVFFAGEFLLLFQALDFTTVSRASIFFYTMPFWTAIAAHFLIPGEKLTLVRVTGLVLAIGGVVLALSNNFNSSNEMAIIGDIYCLLGAMLWSGIVIIARTTRFSKACPEMQLIYQLGVSAFLLLAIAPFAGDLVRNLTPMITLLFSIQVLLVTCFGFLTWFWLLSIYPASSVASFSFLTPIFGVVSGWLILGEKLDDTILLALVLVCLGVILVNQRTSTR